jgi:hypothetical protein
VDTTWWTRTGDRRCGWRPGIADRGDDTRRLDAPPGRRRLGEQQPRQLSSKDFEGIMLLRTGLATAATVGCGGTPPSSWRLGALLSSDDYGSSVGRPGGGHPVYGDAWIDRGLA